MNPSRSPPLSRRDPSTTAAAPTSSGDADPDAAAGGPMLRQAARFGSRSKWATDGPEVLMAAGARGRPCSQRRGSGRSQPSGSDERRWRQRSDGLGGPHRWAQQALWIGIDGPIDGLAVFFNSSTEAGSLSATVNTIFTVMIRQWRAGLPVTVKCFCPSPIKIL